MNKFDSGKDWTFAQIEDCYLLQQDIAENVFNIDYYPNQIEIITSEQMLDAYSATGMPMMYNHWSFGKRFVSEQEKYRRGQMGLAYEIVINSNPCIAYLMEENTMCMQALVLAHACFGHNSVFKGNETFRQWTDAEGIIDYLVFAKHYVQECEHKYGIKEVEKVLDAAHALQYNGIDRYKRPSPLSKVKQTEKQKARVEFDRLNYNDMWRTVPKPLKSGAISESKFPAEPEENILYFLEKHAPNLDDWKRELLRIVRKVAQYFYPQMLTQKLNEGFATFTHYNIIHEMYNRDQVTDGFMLEFTNSHTNVITQRAYSAQLNPYAIGFAMYNDIKRVCLNPTKEDERWFRGNDWVGSGDWISATQFAMKNFKDESFIMQYLSPTVMRDLKLMCVLDDDENPDMMVTAIQDDVGYRHVRDRLSDNCNVNNALPDIQVDNVNVWGDRTLSLIHHSTSRHLLRDVQAMKTIYHLSSLWGYSVELTSIDEAGNIVDEYAIAPNQSYR